MAGADSPRSSRRQAQHVRRVMLAVVEPCRRPRGGGTRSPTNSPGGRRCPAPTSRPGTARRTRLGHLGWPRGRAAAIYAGMDQPSPHRLGADAALLADISEAEPALGVQVGELGVRRTPSLSNRGATLDAEPGETEVHETGAAAQQIADLGTAAMLIAVEPADLIVVDVAAGRDRAGATGHTGGDQPVVHRLGCNSELDRQSRDRLVVIDVRPHKRRHVRSANRSGITPSFPPTRPGGVHRTVRVAERPGLGRARPCPPPSTPS